MKRRSLYLCVLLCALVPPARAQQNNLGLTYGPLPPGWGEGFIGATPYDLHEQEFGYAYPSVLLEGSRGIYVNASISVGVFETGYDALLRWMDERGYTSYMYAGWDVARWRQAYPNLTFTLTGSNETRTTVDGRPAVLLERTISTFNPELSLTSYGRYRAYWVDLGTTGAGIVVDMQTSEGHTASLGQMTQATDALIATFHFGRSTSSGGTIQPGGDDEIPWEVIIAAGAITAVLVTTARKLLKRPKAQKTGAPAPPASKKKPTRAPEKKTDEPAGYILQLSSDHLVLSASEPATLAVTAWRVDAQGAYHPAPEAHIQIALPPGLAGVVETKPAQGKGQVTCRVTLVQPVPVEPTPLTVTARTPKGGTSAQVVVEARAEYVLEFF